MEEKSCTENESGIDRLDYLIKTNQNREFIKSLANHLYLKGKLKNTPLDKIDFSNAYECEERENPVELKIEPKKNWNYAYVSSLYFVAKDLKESRLYIHIDEVLRHLRKKEQVNDFFASALYSTGIATAFMAPFIIVDLIRRAMGGKSS
jgi:hypothetical protein